MPIHVLGIRHHGVGSARQVVRQLAALQPDLILVEGPPEFDPLLKWVKPGQLEPPVAILGYNEKQPKESTFYPFAAFSPEWQAIQYANQHKIPVQLLDLPLRYSFDPNFQTLLVGSKAGEKDPLSWLARIDGYTNSEIWWERKIENQAALTDPDEYFQAVLMAMEALRSEGMSSSLDLENQWREAYMRKIIREKQAQLYSTIAIVCGAWHAPALLPLRETEVADQQLLRQLPKNNLRIGASWIPWTNERLGMESGYGAGIAAPGWSECWWEHPDQPGAYWLSKVATCFRNHRLDVSSAQVMDALQLARQLAEIRQLPFPGLEEYNEATTTVLCMGQQSMLEWVRTEVIVGNKMGKVAEKLQLLPLQIDFEQQVKRLRLKLEADRRTYRLDLREKLDLERSVFLHQVLALGISWGNCSYDERAKGTFRELWELQWKPEMMVELITRGIWGNTVREAATAWLTHQIQKTDSIQDLARLLEIVLPGELVEVNQLLLLRMHDLAAVSHDLLELLKTVPPVARAYRYGNVRKTDRTMLFQLLEGLITRVSLSIPSLGTQLDDDSANQLFQLLDANHQSVLLLEVEEWKQTWLQALRSLHQHTHPLLDGFVTRLLFDLQEIPTTTAAKSLSRALSTGSEPLFSASWLEGFLKGSSSILLHDNALWEVLNEWTAQLPEEDFLNLVPILRRTFSRYEPSERRKLGEKARQPLQKTQESSSEPALPFDAEQAQKALFAMAALLQPKSV
ncbi:MAG: DUF5682 family protein [Chitinophagales bacterium]